VSGCGCPKYVPRALTFEAAESVTSGEAGVGVRRPWSTLLILTYFRMDQTAKIRALNAALRTLTGSGRIFVTAGIAAFSPEQQARLCTACTPSMPSRRTTTPHREHDFGSFDYAGATIFWKIDYYDRDLNNGRPIPLTRA